MLDESVSCIVVVPVCQHTSALFKVVNMVLREDQQVMTVIAGRRNSPPAVNAKHVIKLGLVIAASARAVNLLYGSPRGKGNFIRGDADHGAMLLVQAVNVDGAGGIDFLPFEEQRGKLGDLRPRQPGKRRAEGLYESNEDQEGAYASKENWR